MRLQLRFVELIKNVQALQLKEEPERKKYTHSVVIFVCVLKIPFIQQ